MTTHALRIGVVSLCLALAGGGFEAAAQDRACQGQAAEAWLVGHWNAGEKTSLSFTRSGDKIMWSFKRLEGVMTERWGKKEPAEGAGEVRAVKGCSVELRGKYTSYMNSSRGKAVGAAMNYDLMTNGTGGMRGTGYGWGKENYEIAFRKAD